MCKKNIKLVIEYDGTRYHGWQRQKNAKSIQAEVESALNRITGEHICLHGAGRTDAGVHALGQVASFKTASTIPEEKISDALNTHLPPDIVVIDSRQVDSGFHARYDAKAKFYRYLILNRKYRSAIYENRVWHVRAALDVDLMRKAAAFFVGKHNFAAFCASKSSVLTYERKIEVSKISRRGELIVFDTIGQGYLYNMVRIIVGTLLEVGMKKRSPEDIVELLECGDRTKAGITAPPQGLYLMKVIY